MRAGDDGSPGLSRLSVSLWLVIVNAVVYAAQLIVPLAGATAGHVPPRLESYLALHPGDLLHGALWQLLTFQVLHGGPFHLLINCAMLYIFGRPMEVALGRNRFLLLYFGSGAFGGLVQAVCSWTFPLHFGTGEVLGASAGVFGLIAAFAVLNSEMPITMLLAFIIPVSLKAKYLLVVEAVLALLGMLAPPSGIAHAAHLGGMLAGIFYVRQAMHWHWRWPSFGRGAQRGQAARELVGVNARKSALRRRPPPDLDDTLSPEEFLTKEVDPILDKISAHGIQSLTEREKRILEAARRKMQKR